MSRTDGNKPTGKPDQRNRKAERNRKPDSAQKPKPEQRQDVKEQIHASDVPAAAPSISAVAPPDTPPIAAVTTAPIAAVTTAVNAPIAASPSADAASVSLQTIAQAYGDYTKKSLEEMRSFVEKLTGVRSPNKAIELQTEFVKQAYATFVAESQKICELHNELAKQSFKPLERMVAKASRTAR